MTGLPMRLCGSCGLPVACDAFGNTDHVCLSVTDRWMIGVDVARPDGEPATVLVMDSTTGGVTYYDQTREHSQAWAPVFLPWFTVPVWHDDTDPED